jgi:solute carrier family 25 carnitine/acylcarnitine transporter 20/29
MASPLVGVAVINAALFGVYGFLLDTQQKLEGNRFGEPALHQVFWAGAGSGFINSIISGPTELVKIQLQNQKEGRRSFTQHTMKGPLDCFQKIYRQEGLRGCLRGMNATILRETPSYGVYFAAFETIQRQLQRDEQISPWSLMMAGGLSGVFGWISTYPMDVIKTKIQAQPISSSKNYRGIIDCGRAIVKAEGPTVLWRGLGATIVRAFPTNAVIFLTYSMSMNFLDRPAE